MKKWGFRTHDECPRCKKKDETALHVLQCQHSTARDEWSTQLTDMQQWMEDQKTDPAISKAILHNLKKWRKCRGIFSDHYRDKQIRKAIRDQNDIGWEQFLLGRISYRWSNIQLTYYQKRHMKKTGEKWAEKLIQYIWKLHWGIWNHRNEILHDGDNHTVLGTKDMEKEIEKELKRGCDLFLPSEKYLFRGVNMN